MGPEGFDRQYAKQALKVARSDPRAVKVGAVLVCKGQEPIAAHGDVLSAGIKIHAEANALRRAQDERHNTRGAVLYTTLEPCIEEVRHYEDKPCWRLILEAGVRQVFYGVQDPNPNIRGKGIDRLLESNVGCKPFGDQFDQEIVRIMGQWYRKESRAITAQDLRTYVRSIRGQRGLKYTNFAVGDA